MIEVDVAVRQGSFDLVAAFTAGAGITTLFGPSGSGKTTLINLFAGLVRPDRGILSVGGEPLTDTERGVFVPPHRRRVGLVFQDAQLFPHLSVRQNLVFGRWFAPRTERRITLDPVVEALGIGDLLDRRPRALSGGERQRVAFGRALLASPRLLLMDEPLAALDEARKREALPLIESMRDVFQIPIVYVSHSVEEVARLASTVVVLRQGRVEAVGPPSVVLRSAPGTDRFQVVSVLDGILGPADAEDRLTPVVHPAGVIWLAGTVGPAGRSVRVVIRGTDVALALTPPRDLTIQTCLSGAVAEIRESDGPHATVDIALDGGGTLASVVTARAVRTLGLAPGRTVHALVKAVALDERPIAGP